ncbi:hypothetical protein Agub_g4517, partial [Astrephomene gubernaculifera]
GPVLEPLGRAAAAAGAAGGAGGAAGTGALPPPPLPLSGLREVVVECQLLLEAPAALTSLAHLPALSALTLTGLPLSPSSAPATAAALAALTRLTALTLTFEHRYAAGPAEQHLAAALRCLTRLNYLGLDFIMDTGAGGGGARGGGGGGGSGNLWNAGELLTGALAGLSELRRLALPKGFLYDKSHPEFLRVLAGLPYLTDLALGSIILSPETAAAAVAAAAADAVTPSERGRGRAGAAVTSPPASSSAAAPGGGCAGGGGGGLEPRTLASLPSLPSPSAAVAVAAATSTAPAAAAVLARPWRRLALGAGMPCYLEALLPVLGVKSNPVLGVKSNPVLGVGTGVAGGTAGAGSAAAAVVGAAGNGSEGDGRGAVSTMSAEPSTPPPYSPVRQVPYSGGGAGGGSWVHSSRCTNSAARRSCSRGRVAGASASNSSHHQRSSTGLDLLELSTPCTLQMVQLLPQFVRHDSACCCSSCTSNTTRATAAASTATTATTAAMMNPDPPATPISQTRPLRPYICDGGFISSCSSSCGGTVREVRLLLRLSSNWQEVVSALSTVGPALTSLALQPTYLYGSGTMMGPQVVAAVAGALPYLRHLELHRLNTDPRDITCLAERMPALRFILLGVAREALERRGPGHAAALVRTLLGALAGAGGRKAGPGAGAEAGRGP